MKKLFNIILLTSLIIPAALAAQDYTEENENRISELNDMINTDGGSLDLYYGRAVCFINLNRNDEAFKDAASMMKLDSGDYRCYLIRGFAFHNLQKFREALAEYDRSIEKNPDNASAYLNKGLVYYSLEKYDDALRMYDMAISIDPENPDTLASKAVCLWASGRKTESLQMLEDVLISNPDYSYAINELVWYYSVTADKAAYNPERALQLAVKLINISNRSANTLDTIAAAYACNGFFEGAVFYQNLAVEKAGAENMTGKALNEMKQRLELYKNGKQYRE